MGYVQKGLRWIPAYQITIDGAGQAKVKLEATLVNDLADLDGVVANLVIGVPTFDFKGMLDPISLQTRPRAGRAAGRTRRQLPLERDHEPDGDPVAAERAGRRRAPSEPEVVGQRRRTRTCSSSRVKNVTLRRGERMVVPVVEFEIPYKDVYTLDYEFGPPPEVRGQMDAQKQEELAQKLGEVEGRAQAPAHQQERLSAHDGAGAALCRRQAPRAVAR